MVDAALREIVEQIIVQNCVVEEGIPKFLPK